MAAQVRERVAAARRVGRPVAFVPTMGAFHAGHLELMRRAKVGAELDSPHDPFVVISIFVNPTQFGPGEDYRSYPRDMAGDAEQARHMGVDLIFAPPVEEMYPPGDSTIVEVGRLGEGMCGAFRPGHFRGVATVVCKLLNIVQPDAAYFGMKDYQQLRVIERMVEDLRLATKIVRVPTVREADGLAMSSRNAYLSPEERRTAPTLYRGLLAAQERLARGEQSAAALVAEVRRVVAQEPRLSLEYVELRDADTLETVARVEKSAALALAARLGGARLIDNIILQVS